jgi:hypothetical protein
MKQRLHPTKRILLYVQTAIKPSTSIKALEKCGGFLWHLRVNRPTYARAQYGQQCAFGILRLVSRREPYYHSVKRQASSLKPQASSVKRQASSVKRQASKHHATHWSSRARSWMSLQLVVVEGYYTIKYGISSEAYPLSYKNQVMRADTPSRSLTSGFLVMATTHNSPSGRRTYNVEPYWSKRYVVDLILRRELMQVSKHNKRRWTMQFLWIYFSDKWSWAWRGALIWDS